MKYARDPLGILELKRVAIPLECQTSHYGGSHLDLLARGTNKAQLRSSSLKCKRRQHTRSSNVPSNYWKCYRLRRRLFALNGFCLRSAPFAQNALLKHLPMTQIDFRPRTSRWSKIAIKPISRSQPKSYCVLIIEKMIVVLVVSLFLFSSPKVSNLGRLCWASIIQI